jgi:hypothetical protein
LSQEIETAARRVWRIHASRPMRVMAILSFNGVEAEPMIMDPLRWSEIRWSLQKVVVATLDSPITVSSSEYDPITVYAEENSQLRKIREQITETIGVPSERLTLWTATPDSSGPLGIPLLDDHIIRRQLLDPKQGGIWMKVEASNPQGN